MQVNAHPIGAMPGAVPPASQPAGCSPPQGEESPFAKLLSAQPQAQPKDTAPPADETAKGSAQPDAAPGQDETAESGPSTAHELRPAAPRDVKDDAKPADAAATTTMDPALAQWIASLNRAAAPATPAAADTVPRDASGGVDPQRVDLKGAGLKGADPKVIDTKGIDPKAVDPKAAAPDGAAHKSLGLELPDTTKPVTPDPALVAALDERHAGPHAGERTPGGSGIDGIAALAAGTAVHAATRAEVAAQPVSLPTPVTSPEFKAALGMQVSLLARDGVQHAQLHLNPAEMGPISVRIALDGVQAQVDFGVDSAHTRRIIEAGLPELASALRDAGLTLSGGGVSQHARGGQSQGDADASQRGAGQRGADAVDAAAPAAARRVNLRLPQGAVDLYA